MDMYIEVAKQEDIREIYELQLLCFESEAKMIGSRCVPALMESYEEAKVQFEQWQVLKIVDDKRRIIASVRYQVDEETVSVGRLMVHPEYRGRGIALGLLNEKKKA